MKKLTEKRIKNAIEKFYGALQADENDRFKSWEHCYKVFGENQNNTTEEIVDYLCLNLAFYLASWGMYRGSSFLLQKDYKVHKKAVLEMQKSEYNILRNATPEQLLTEEYKMKVFNLQGELEKIYQEINDSVSKSKTDVSDTLITKIIMGVFGCVPAYDRYVKYTLKEYGLGTNTFKTFMSLRELYELYNEYKNIIDSERSKINSYGFEYPYMKVIDIFLWQIGYDDDIEGKLKKVEEEV